MGVLPGNSSPLLSAALRSREATPIIPLQRVDELSAEKFEDDTFELVPPQVPLEESSYAAPCSSLTNLSKPPPSPLWPTTPPLLCHLVEHNTFLNFYDGDTTSPLIVSRKRAVSDFTGLSLLERGDASLDGFLLPEPAEPFEAATRAEVEEPCSEARTSCRTGQWYGEVHEQPSLPAPPPMPRGDNVYKPHWPYGTYNFAPTTMLLENLPRSMTQDDLMHILDEGGFNGLYDFIYLPARTATTSSNQATINFSRHSYGLLLAAHFHGKIFWGVGEGQYSCKAKWSFDIQGLPALLEHYRNDVSMHSSVPFNQQPGYFVEGWRVPMPAPTRRIRLPRSSHVNYSAKKKEPWTEPSPKKTSEQETVEKDKIDARALEFGSTSEFPHLSASKGR